jgi:hypothetical protein
VLAPECLITDTYTTRGVNSDGQCDTGSVRFMIQLECVVACVSD